MSILTYNKKTHSQNQYTRRIPWEIFRSYWIFDSSFNSLLKPIFDAENYAKALEQTKKINAGRLKEQALIILYILYFPERQEELYVFGKESLRLDTNFLLLLTIMFGDLDYVVSLIEQEKSCIDRTKLFQIACAFGKK